MFRSSVATGDSLYVLQMWLWIITGLNIMINVHGFSSGGFPQSCETLEPQHGSSKPQKNRAPYNISFTGGHDGDPYTGTESL